MDEMLKGNYKLNQPKNKESQESVESADLQSEFEASALQKLGGSIAFVKKSSGFLWKGKK